MTTAYVRTYYGVPRVIEKMKLAPCWRNGHINGSLEPQTRQYRFNRLEFFEDYIFREPDSVNSVTCYLRIARQQNLRDFCSVNGYVSQELAEMIKADRICAFVHEHRFERRDLENKLVGSKMFRESLTTCFDGRHTVRYILLFRFE